MTKKWSFADFEFALDSAWSAFENTLRTHGVTDKEIQRFVRVSELRSVRTDVERALTDVITWEEE